MTAASREGRDMTVDTHDKQALATLKAVINELEGVSRDRFTELGRQAVEAGGSFSIRETPSHRRYEIGRGLYLLADSGQLDNDLVTSIAMYVTKKQYKTGGESLADLDSDQAEQFADLCSRLACNEIDLTYITQSNTFQLIEGKKQ